MKQTRYSHHDVKTPLPFYHLFLWLDAVAFSVAFFKGVEAVLLISDGVYSAPYGLALAASWTLALAALSGLNARLHGDWSPRKKRIIFSVEIAGFLLVLYGAYRFASMPPHKGIDTLWIANQWRMLPKNWWLMAKLSPGWTAIMALGAAAAVRVVQLRLRWQGTALMAAMCAVVLLQIKDFPYGDKVVTYVVVFAGPLVLAAFAALALMPRLFSRTVFGCALGLIIFWTYSGFLPKMPPSGFANLPGVRRLYPPPGASPDFPLTFMRDIELDVPHGAIFTTYGPACGVVRIDLKSGRANVIDEKGLIRFLRTNPGENFIYGTNWDLTELAVISKEPFKIVDSQNLFHDDVLALWDHVLDGKYQYIGTTEYAGIGKFVRDAPGAPLRKIAFLNFHKMGLIKFKSGAFGIARNPATRRLYVEVGMLDTSDSYSVIEVNPDTFTVEAVGQLPEGGLALTFVPQHNAIIAASFFSNRLYEIDAATLKIRRTFTGPINSRNVVYDPARDAIYTLSFLEGRLYVIRYSDMETLFHVAVGKRPNALALWPEKDTLFIGSSEGLFSVDLKTYLAPVEKDFKKR